MGYQAIALGIIEWFVMCFLHGLNEGINGLLKKRGGLIEEVQHTSWLMGHDIIEGRTMGYLAGICVVSMAKVKVTKVKTHFMRAIYKWSRKYKTLWVIVIMGLSRKIPH